MRVSVEGLKLIQRWEGCKLDAYLDSGGLPTIGWGTTRYPDGTRVKLGDSCNQEQADMWLRSELSTTERAVDDLTVDTISVRQFEALVSMAYNCGIGAFRRSTLRKRVNNNPDDPYIRDAFLMWVFDNGQFVPGLRNRRIAEAEHYFGRYYA